MKNVKKRLFCVFFFFIGIAEYTSHMFKVEIFSIKLILKVATK